VLPGAIATPFWGLAGLPFENLPEQMVMSAPDLVDAALAGFDLGEFATLPSLPDAAQWTAFDAARVALRPSLSLKVPAQRYRVARRAAA
jgi:short-subunit dehydrogenase